MATTAKDAARDLIERLPDDATWEDIRYGLCVREKLEAGLDDVEHGRLTPHEDIRAELLEKRRRAS